MWRDLGSLFSFKGELNRLGYAAVSAAAFLAQHLFVYLAVMAFAPPFGPPWWFWLNPFRALPPGGLPWWIPLAAMAVTVIVDWLLAASAFRRTQHARGNAVFATLTIIPIVQVGVMLWLALAPQLPEPPPEAEQKPARASSRSAALGLLAGAALSVALVAFSTLVLKTYGYMLFLGAPFIIGATIAFVANRDADLALGETSKIVIAGVALGGVALVGFAIEGLICLVLASPLIAGMALLGAMLGRAIAGARRPRSSMVACVALIPLLMLGELAMPPRAEFETTESVEVAAPPEAVWASVTNMGRIDTPPAAPYRWGLAYPEEGHIDGAGVGAVRRGVFSTGVAYERVVVWNPPRELTFVVLSNPPAMREMSPHAHVMAPHVAGYFETSLAQFRITPLTNGRTRLSLTTRHEVNLEPAIYWLPFAKLAIRENKMRVLNHFARRAEAAAGTAG